MLHAYLFQLDDMGSQILKFGILQNSVTVVFHIPLCMLEKESSMYFCISHFSQYYNKITQ